MIEIIQQTEKNAEGKLPKNIRQIGNPEKDFRIYMEDYVYTYLHPTQLYAMGDCQQGIPYGVGELLPRLLILVGEINHFSNRSCAFICGAIRVENGAFSEELPELNEDAWRRIQKELEQYFGKSEVVGWVLDIPGNELEVTKEMEEVHRKNFISPYQFFFLMDSREREEAFYVWKSGHLTRKEGYFIYYEKNPGMQEYMISKREDAFGSSQPSEDIEDRAAKHYRAMMREKKEQSYECRTGVLSYLSSLLMVLVLCTFSVLLLGSIRRMDHMEQTISVMSGALESTEEEKENENNKVAVETVNGNIYPIGTTQNDTPQTEGGASDVPGQKPASEGANNGLPQEEPSADVPQNNGVPQSIAEGELSQNVPQSNESPQGEPEGQQAGDTSQNSEAPQGDNVQSYRSQGYYIVQQGDSLRGICYKIYRDYSMIQALCEANAIEDQDYIWVGQKIILP